MNSRPGLISRSIVTRQMSGVWRNVLGTTLALMITGCCGAQKVDKSGDAGARWFGYPIRLTFDHSLDSLRATECYTEQLYEELIAHGYWAYTRIGELTPAGHVVVHLQMVEGVENLDRVLLTVSSAAGTACGGPRTDTCPRVRLEVFHGKRMENGRLYKGFLALLESRVLQVAVPRWPTLDRRHYFSPRTPRVETVCSGMP